MLLVSLSLACYRPGPDGCPEVPYTPSGTEVTLASECDADEANECAFLCLGEPTCDGEVQVITCEPRREVAAYASSECRDCQIDMNHGIVSLTCGSL